MKQEFTKPTKKKLELKKTTIAKFKTNKNQMKNVWGGEGTGNSTGGPQCNIVD